MILMNGLYKRRKYQETICSRFFSRSHLLHKTQNTIRWETTSFDFGLFVFFCHKQKNCHLFYGAFDDLKVHSRVWDVSKYRDRFNFNQGFQFNHLESFFFPLPFLPPSLHFPTLLSSYGVLLCTLGYVFQANFKLSLPNSAAQVLTLQSCTTTHNNNKNALHLKNWFQI